MWDKNNKAIKANQMAFEFEKGVVEKIQKTALKAGLTTSNQIRKLIGLSYSPPKRPRLTISLSEEDCAYLGEKYNVDPKNYLDIKRQIIQELDKKLNIAS